MVFPLLLVFFATAVPAFAYVDPNTSGLIAQIATPLLLILAVAWNRLRRWVLAVAQCIRIFLLSGTK